MAYNNDNANHCTFGVGTLVHHGPCTAEELQRPVTVPMVDGALALRVRGEEAAVRAGVANVQLTQAQFDALVSFAYNVGARGATATLAAANAGMMSSVVAHMQATCTFILATRTVGVCRRFVSRVW